jgi:hypothetical protein
VTRSYPHPPPVQRKIDNGRTPADQIGRSIFLEWEPGKYAQRWKSQPSTGGRAEPIEIIPLVIVDRAFPVRPSSLPDIRDFVRRQLAPTILSEDDVRILCDQVAELVLDTAGTSGMIQVSLRIFPAYAEVDVLFAESAPAAVSFAGWLSGALRREGMTVETAARRLSVSTKTVGRWVGGTTEPRLRDLPRIREVFGDLPFL